MDTINKVKSISIWIFIIPFLAINTCLILITNFHELFPNKEHVIHNTIPYIDGGASISRTARVFPTYLIFKPAMFLTAYLLIRYWLYVKKIILNIHGEHKNLRKIIIFGISSAICLIIHSIFLGIKFDYDLYKLFRRVIMLVFIIFEVVAQAYLVVTFYSIKNKLLSFINLKFLKLKAILVSILVFVMIVSIPIVSMPGNKHIKHALEWDFFLGVILFYVLTFFMWKKQN
ncbi:hypothetical protein [Candidatus Pelagibacter communis]|uniref:hypothetical protein n=1 Tax=Pelagibacter ubique TaxID=198252 RepID=UPI00094D0744|nr:hypothetical protein [Candidatus Pelagibacter ubique]